jgi:integrase/recombinase XerD
VRSAATECCESRGKGGKVVLVPLPPAVSTAVARAAGERAGGPLLLNRRGTRMDRHVATRRLRHLASDAWIRLPRMHPHMLRHTFVTTMLDAGVDLRDVQIAARHADPRTTMRYDRARKNLERHPNYILAAYMASGTRVPSSGGRRVSSGHPPLFVIRFWGGERAADPGVGRRGRGRL